LRIVKLYKHLTNEKKEYVLSKQLLRSGTSIGAMVREAEQAKNKADFIHKLSIVHCPLSINLLASHHGKKLNFCGISLTFLLLLMFD
jgi:hypothetical protein